MVTVTSRTGLDVAADDDDDDDDGSGKAAACLEPPLEAPPLPSSRYPIFFNSRTPMLSAAGTTNEASALPTAADRFESSSRAVAPNVSNSLLATSVLPERGKHKTCAFDP